MKIFESQALGQIEFSAMTLKVGDREKDADQKTLIRDWENHKKQAFS